MAKKFRIELEDRDLFQLLDGLEIRAEAWEKTAEYLRTEKMPQASKNAGIRRKPTTSQSTIG